MSTLTFPPQGQSGYFSSPLLSTINFDEHELIFFLPANLLAEMRISQPVQKHIYDHVAARMAQLVKWVERGHTLIVLGLEPAQFHVANIGAKEGFGDFPPFDQIKLTQKSGSSIQAVPGREISDLLGSGYPAEYTVVMEGANLIPLLTVRATNRGTGRPDIVAGYLRIGDGLIVFAPFAQGPGQPYWIALERLPSVLRRAKAEFPAWIDCFRTAFEMIALRRCAHAEKRNRKTGRGNCGR